MALLYIDCDSCPMPTLGICIFSNLEYICGPNPYMGCTQFLYPFIGGICPHDIGKIGGVNY